MTSSSSMAVAFYLPDANVSVQHHASTIGEQPLEMLICRVVRCIGPVYIQRINYLTGSHVVGWPDLCTDFKHVACEDVYQGWDSLIGFLSESLVFCQKISK